MSGGDQAKEGPGESTPAFCHSALHVYACTLDWRDALAWERLPGEPSRRQKFALMASVILVCLAAGLAKDIVAPNLPDWALAVPGAVLGWGIWRLGLELVRRQRAHRRLPKPQMQRVEEWGDHLDVTCGATRLILSAETISQVILTPRHVFVRSAANVAILPDRTFDSPDAMRAFALVWQGIIADPDGWIYGDEAASQDTEGDRDEA